VLTFSLPAEKPPVLNCVLILTKFFLFNFPFCPLNLTFAVQIQNMANHKATKKDMRQASKRRERNKYYGKTTRNAIRDLKTLTDKAAAGDKTPDVISMIDKLAKRGIIHKNKASNLKSKLTKRVNTLA
jgi:small subunit ribosomal protein S20